MKKRVKRVVMNLESMIILLSFIMACTCVFGIFYSTNVEGFSIISNNKSQFMIDTERRQLKPILLLSSTPSLDKAWDVTKLYDTTFSPFNQKIFENDVQANNNLQVEESAEIDTEESVIEEAISDTNNYQEPETDYCDPVTRFERKTDLAVNRKISVDKMNEIINKTARICGGTPFEGNGDIFIEASEKSGLDPIYIFAHASWESGYGKSSQARNKHNYFGIASFDSSPNSAYIMGDNMRAGIINGAIWIAENYYKQGQTTLNLMIYGKKCYASTKDEWINGILSIMNRYID